MLLLFVLWVSLTEWLCYMLWLFFVWAVICLFTAVVWFWMFWLVCNCCVLIVLGNCWLRFCLLFDLGLFSFVCLCLLYYRLDVG